MQALEKENLERMVNLDNTQAEGESNPQVLVCLLHHIASSLPASVAIYYFSIVTWAQHLRGTLASKGGPQAD